MTQLSKSLEVIGEDRARWELEAGSKSCRFNQLLRCDDEVDNEADWKGWFLKVCRSLGRCGVEIDEEMRRLEGEEEVCVRRGLVW